MYRFLNKGGSKEGKQISRLFHSRSILRAEVELFIDGKSVKIEQGAALIQACEKAGVDIPRFCYHDRLSVAGNCRMCLVELEKAPKPIASCAMPVMPGMKVKTNTPLVKKAREGVMEFLLANHPLDCPVCDQGGECDLQDQSVRYGSDRSRFHEFVGKRAVEDKNLGPLVKTIMTRCIHCTRCVRFSNEVAGAVEMGTSGRGNDMQIGTYIEKTVSSELSGNIIDLCPVGALTSKPYAFNARPWELKRTESIDVMDAVGSNIRVDSRGIEVLRVVPRLNDEVNEEWISDKTRFSYDGLKLQRLTTPMIRQGNSFVPASWPEALEIVSQKFKSVNPTQRVAIAGQHADSESLVALKDLFNQHDSENLSLDQVSSSSPGLVDLRSNYVFNTSINGIEASDWILLIGTNPRHEAAVLNSRIRKAYLHYQTDVGVIGQAPKLNYEFDHLGETIESISKEDHPFLKKLAKSQKPMVVVGSSIYERADAAQILKKIAGFVLENKAKFIHDDWRGYSVLQRSASHVAAYDIGYTGTTTPATIEKAKFVYLLASDEFKSLPKDAFVVYQGHHGDLGAEHADVILPGAAFTEKGATFVNTEGRTQVTRAAVAPPGAAREDWTIIRALSEVSGKPLPYDEIGQLRNRMAQVSPTLVQYEELDPSSFVQQGLEYAQKAVSSTASSSTPLELPLQDFYRTDVISRASPTMAKSSKAFTKQERSEEDEKQQLIAV